MRWMRRKGRALGRAWLDGMSCYEAMWIYGNILRWEFAASERPRGIPCVMGDGVATAFVVAMDRDTVVLVDDELAGFLGVDADDLMELAA